MVVTLGIAGVLALFAALLPRVLLAIGVGLGVLPWSDSLDPLEHVDAVRVFAEFGLLVALAGAGG